MIHNDPKVLWDRYLVSHEGCWEYQSPHKKPRIKIRGKLWAVSRLAYYLTLGEIPEGFLICHHCDNPKCINPKHLFLGTHQDNRDDCVRKGRQAKGNSSGARLHPEKWKHGKDHWLYKKGYLVSGYKNAMFGKTQTAQTRKKISEALKKASLLTNKKGDKCPASKITEEDRSGIPLRLSDGETTQEVAKSLGISPQHVRLIRRRIERNGKY